MLKAMPRARGRVAFCTMDRTQLPVMQMSTPVTNATTPYLCKTFVAGGM